MGRIESHSYVSLAVATQTPRVPPLFERTNLLYPTEKTPSIPRPHTPYRISLPPMTAAGPSTFSQDGPVRTPTIRSSFLAPPRICTQCNPRRRENTRNLVVCIDGTSNIGDTNVGKLFLKIDLESTMPEQRAYFATGVGTHRLPLQILNIFDMVVAWSIGDNIKDAYRWLARIYQEGDQIYLFGFSRGAYQVRVLAGMIHELGLIRTPTEKQIEMAYDEYEAIRSGKPKARRMVREIEKMLFWKDVRVHFIGVWDTVSSVGLIRGDVFVSSSSSVAHACHFRHALALDELRVKFMPEYFQEVNSRTYGRQFKRVLTSPDIWHAAVSTSGQRGSTVSDDGSGSSKEKMNETAEIKEVWFAGSHSDVGGWNDTRKSHQAGNASLLWMRREAADNGLMLQPTDLVWVPDDLDLGISDSMSHAWKAIEYMPIKHQVSFSGAGKDARRWHRQQPRRVIPGQKVHASILYANAYNPRAVLGESFNLHALRTGLEDVELDGQIWETGLFDGTAASELVTQCGRQEVAPVYLSRLLFMLRFKEGKQCIRGVPGWQRIFLQLIHDESCAILVRFAITVVYFEASYDPEASAHRKSPQPVVELPQNMFDDMRKWLASILTSEKRQRDVSIVVALMRPLTKHGILRAHVLTPDNLDALMKFLDMNIERPGGNFGQAIDGLSCLLRCEDTQHVIIQKLRDYCPSSNASRLSRVLRVNDPRFLLPALRMVLTLARIPEGRHACSEVKHRLRQLASKDGQSESVGLLATEILLATYDADERYQINIRNAHVLTNLTRLLVSLNSDRHDLPDRGEDSGQWILRHIFGLGNAELDKNHRKLIYELKNTVQNRDAQERTRAVMTLLELCKTPTIRTYLCEINLLGVFIDQLQYKKRALLAAYALVTCLEYSDMKESIKDNSLLPKHIVRMLRLDYFDDAVDQVEGFQIFGGLMRHSDLREKINNYNISQILNTKLGWGKQKEIRTSLICLDIFRSFDPNGPWTDDLVRDSLTKLQNAEWKVQKVGVAVLFTLAETEHGVRAISSRIPDIIKMLLPTGYLPISGEVETQPTVRTTAWMMGSAYALRVLAQNKTLRDRTRETLEYASLKHLYMSGILVDEEDMSPLDSWSRNRNQTGVMDMVGKMIEAIDGELSEGPVDQRDTM